MTGPAAEPLDKGPLVVGLGSLDRGDDAVGRAVARAVVRAVATLPAPGVRVVECEDPTALVDLWDGHDPVVVVDAVRSGARPGTVHRLETGRGGAPLPESAWSHAGRHGTHALGVATAVELARALHRLPPRLTLVGVEAAGFDYGAPLSSAVADAVGEAVDTVLAALGVTSPAGWPGHP